MSKTKAENGSADVLPIPRRQVVTDPTLKAAAKLDRIMADLSQPMRQWAVAWLTAKYLVPDLPPTVEGF